LHAPHTLGHIQLRRCHAKASWAYLFRLIKLLSSSSSIPPGVPDAVMLAYLRSPAFLARALDALVGADARPQALLALAPAAGMLAYLRCPAILALAPLAVMLASVQRLVRGGLLCLLTLAAH